MAKKVNGVATSLATHSEALSVSPVTKRIDTLVARAVVTLYDADGKPLGEAITDEIKIFRASVPDVWAALEKAVQVEKL